MNNKRYIILRYTDPSSIDCDIYAINGNKKIKLNKKDKIIMRQNRILQKFPSIKVDDNTYLYPNYVQITLLFNKAKLKSKKVNRNKSKRIIAGIALSTALGVGIVGCNIIKHNSNKVNNPEEETIVYSTEAINNQKQEFYTFNYEYENPNDKESLDNSYSYIDTYKKYEELYGVDARLLCAIGAQESSGIHRSNSINGGYATGIMGIENIWDEANINVYNFKTKSYENITVDYSRIGELDYNVKIGAAIFQNYYYNSLNNATSIDESEILAFTIQKYNMGPGNMNKILKTEGNWIENREILNSGDSKYFEHVLSRLDNATDIKIRLLDGSYHTTKVINTAILNKKQVRT